MSNFEHVMVSRAEMAKILMEAKGYNPDDYELVNMDVRSNQLQQIMPLYMGPWTDTSCPFDLFTFGVKKKDDKDSVSTQPSEDEGAV